MAKGKFKYEGMNAENRKVEGEIDAKDDDMQRDFLEDKVFVLKK
jgi:hypothetical protein